MITDEFDLTRFQDAQDSGGTYQQALAELRRGRKVSHWMWFVFPQLAGLGHSATARHFALSSLTEAQAYSSDPVLGARLIECSETLLSHADASATDIFGHVDALKLRSSMTLFARAAPTTPTFTKVLDAFFAGAPDPRTEELLSQAN